MSAVVLMRVVVQGTGWRRGFPPRMWLQWISITPFSSFSLFPFSFPLLAWPCQSAAASSHCSPLLLWWESSGEGMVWQPKAHPCYRAKPEPSLNQGSKTEVEARLGMQFWLYLVSWRLLLKRKSLDLRRLFLLRPVAVWISAIRSVCCWDWNVTISISN